MKNITSFKKTISLSQDHLISILKTGFVSKNESLFIRLSLSLIFLLTACGIERHPKISDLMITTSTVSPGDTLQGNILVEDDAGLEDLSIEVRLIQSVSKTGTTAINSSLFIPITGATSELKSSTVGFLLQTSQTAPVGRYDSFVRAIASDQTLSNTIDFSFSIVTSQ